jgi:hypothetical protein
MTLGAAYSQLFMTSAEAGMVDGRTYTYLIVDGNNWELGKGVYTASGTTLSRVTVLASRISGTLGTTKITLTGTAQVRIIESADDMGALRGTRAVTGTTDTIANSDLGRAITYSNASAIAASLAQAGASSQFLDGWCVHVKNTGAGVLTITPATSTINGGSTLVLAQNMGAFIWSDGTNYHAYFYPVTKPLLAANNLADLASAATARGNLDVNLRNRLINGTFSVDQRNGGSSTTVADNAYWADRWRYLGEASAALTARLTGMGRYPHNGALVFTGTTDKGGIWQVIEGINCKDLRGQSVVLSAYVQVSNARIGNIKMGIAEFTGTEDSVSGDPISAWGADGTTPTLAAGWAFVNTPANLSVTTSIVKYSVTATVGASANNLAVFIWNDDKSYNASDSFQFAEVQLEAGSVATSFERRSFGDELMLCERYYQKTYDVSTAPGTVSANGQLASRSPVTAGTAVDTFQKGITTRLRSAPTVTWYSPVTGTASRFRDVTGGADVTVTGTSGNGETTSGYPTCASSPTAGSFLTAHYTLNSEL